jgi:hypothetical protein
MPGFDISDGADEFRIELIGRFTGECVTLVEQAWKTALSVPASRRYTVDISRMIGFDGPGRKLLATMYRHGTQFAAGTPEALVLLGEISAIPRRGPVAVPSPVKVISGRQQPLLLSARAAAAGK